jgi:hypothetical protein
MASLLCLLVVRLNNSQPQSAISAAWLQPNLKHCYVYLSTQFHDAEKFELTSHLPGVPKRQKEDLQVAADPATVASRDVRS